MFFFDGVPHRLGLGSGELLNPHLHLLFQRDPFRFQALQGLPQLADLPAEALPPLGL